MSSKNILTGTGKLSGVSRNGIQDGLLVTTYNRGIDAKSSTAFFKL